jgi:hypothetical protein
MLLKIMLNCTGWGWMTYLYNNLSNHSLKRQKHEISGLCFFHELTPYAEAGIQDDIETLVLKTLFKEYSR